MMPPMTAPDKKLRARQLLGKYRIERRLGDGGFASVYQAADTIEGTRAALKIPHASHVDRDMMQQFKREVRLCAQLQHPNILPLKNAEIIDERFVMAFPLGDSTLAKRMEKRISTARAMSYIEQMLEAVAYAHDMGVIHCDIKPENIILFHDDTAMLSDFGISKIAVQTITASGSGTVGYIAPEQAMGKPSLRSDVFSLGLVAYRLLTGELPEWPFDWPPPGIDRLRRKAHPDLIKFLRRAIELNPRNRFRDAQQMLKEFQRIKKRAIVSPSSSRSRTTKPKSSSKHHWKNVQHRQFRQRFGKTLEAKHHCPKCDGPISEFMGHCPWCTKRLARHTGHTDFPHVCPRCNRGVKSDWRFCAWCYGKGFEPATHRQYPDKRYSARCSNPECTRKSLMPFMRYCPWCRGKVKHKWKIPGSRHRCKNCKWGIVPEFWSACPWCGTKIETK